MKFLVVSLVFVSIVLGNTFAVAEAVIEETFSRIYSEAAWGSNAEGNGSSGEGSTAEATKIYREFLQDFLEVYDIHSVVDVGCGDWEFSRLIDWQGISYRGYDVVPSVIRKNKEKYSSGNIHFFCGDATKIQVPSADLLICKDVLQHLPIASIQAFLKQISKFKYCLITNDVDPNTWTSNNPDVSIGGYRTLDLTKPPFNVKGQKILIFLVPGTFPVVKQVLLVKREENIE